MGDRPWSGAPLVGPPRPTTSTTFDLVGIDAPLRWPDVFGADRPVEIEVGSGKGLFLLNAARARPDRSFLGVEIAAKYAREAADRLARRGVGNARVLRADIRELLNDWVPPRSVAAFHIYFPDPWWKARHRKRRVFTGRFADLVARALIPGGPFHIATDVGEYFGVMQEIMTARPSFAPLPTPEPSAGQDEQDYLTSFERKYRRAGRAIYRASYELAPG